MQIQCDLMPVIFPLVGPDKTDPSLREQAVHDGSYVIVCLGVDNIAA